MFVNLGLCRVRTGDKEGAKEAFVRALTMEENPREYINQLFGYLPQLMFVLLPLFALLIQLCYLGAGFHYLQHLVFTVHYHCFVYVTMTILSLLMAMVLSMLSATQSGWRGVTSKASQFRENSVVPSVFKPSSLAAKNP